MTVVRVNSLQNSKPRFRTGIYHQRLILACQRFGPDIVVDNFVCSFQYTVQFLLDGVTVNSVIDTGSGVGQLACTGATINPAYSSTLSVYNPTSSAFTLVSNTSAACTEVCAQTQQCIAKPAQSGACEYYYAYADQSFLYGRVYTANMTFPSSDSNVSAPNIIFGCSYNTSTNPYMYDSTNSLFGMDWEPLSMWNQLINESIVTDTLYLCLGDGGDLVNSSISSQAGVIIFGNTTSVSLSGTSAGGNTVTATMLDSVNLKDSNGNQILQPPSMWLTLNSLSLVSSSGSSTSLSMSTSNYYILDTGTSLMLLVNDAFNSLNATFCSSLAALSNSTISITCSWSSVFTVNISGVSAILTKNQLNSFLPNMSFVFSNASGAVNIRPSAYMVLDGGYSLGSRTASNNYLIYNVNIGSAGAATNQGLLGNAWMNHMLIKQTQSTRQLSITLVDSCNDITYGTAPALLSPTNSPSSTPSPTASTSPTSSPSPSSSPPTSSPTSASSPSPIMSPSATLSPSPMTTSTSPGMTTSPPAEIVEQVTYTFVMDFTILSSNQSALASFNFSITFSIASAANIPLSYVTIVSISPGSVVVVTAITFPPSAGVSSSQASQIATSLASSPSSTFSSSFQSTYGISSISATAQTASSGSSGLGTGAIVGIAVGAGGGAALIGAFSYMFFFRKAAVAPMDPNLKPIRALPA
ncbi:hypothetical protein CEUSTIGMA_g12709.t1 [Chlamydomonas eustigma]|uniref:Peptidase A1 domain-containing protein n=1 Tax=Chlamydomonas eustigma TaxID=1157962 RepID=A0A250XQT5_9CHLO|nr:hypothetical protein CEUSTIGMA_g12709.t1 [Chlamydomonas eustigma]|eukprot:GAX85292.1 hypothetical protein CEUSTIGMA_g12709.t1 [Chlamydomonas eustigma]